MPDNDVDYGTPRILSGRYSGNTERLPGTKTVKHNYASQDPGLGFSASTPGLYAISRGYITTVMDTPKIVFNFMFNPNEIAYGYDIDDSQIPNAMVLAEGTNREDAKAFKNMNTLVAGASINFNIFVDRSYEVNVGGDKVGSPEREGVLHDIAVLEALVGNGSTGQILSKPVEVVFTRSGDSGTGLGFYGFITACNINFVGFGVRMIPTRAVISLTLRQNYRPTPDLGILDSITNFMNPWGDSGKNKNKNKNNDEEVGGTENQGSSGGGGSPRHQV